jgi:hypothetical protein
MHGDSMKSDAFGQNSIAGITPTFFDVDLMAIVGRGVAR